MSGLSLFHPGLKGFYIIKNACVQCFANSHCPTKKPECDLSKNVCSKCNVPGVHCWVFLCKPWPQLSPRTLGLLAMVALRRGSFLQSPRMERMRAQLCFCNFLKPFVIVWLAYFVQRLKIKQMKTTRNYPQISS